MIFPSLEMKTFLVAGGLCLSPGISPGELGAMALAVEGAAATGVCTMATLPSGLVTRRTSIGVAVVLLPEVGSSTLTWTVSLP